MPAVDCAKRLLKCISKWRHTASHGHVAGKPSQYPYCCLYVLVHIVAIKRHDQISLLCYASFTHQRRLDRGFHGDKCPSELLGRVHWPQAIRVDMSLTHGLAPQSPLVLIAPSVMICGLSTHCRSAPHIHTYTPYAMTSGSAHDLARQSRLGSHYYTLNQCLWNPKAIVRSVLSGLGIGSVPSHWAPQFLVAWSRFGSKPIRVHESQASGSCSLP